MQKTTLLFFLSFFSLIYAQDIRQKSPWLIEADGMDPENYYGITAANGMVGLVSSAQPLQVEEVVLNGVFDTYGRGRVSNILKGFNFANMFLKVGQGEAKESISFGNIQFYRQYLDMKDGTFHASFQFNDQVRVAYSLRALRHLPFTSMIEVEVTALTDVGVDVGSEIQAPEILREVTNHYQMINRPHVKIPLMSSQGMSPTGKHILAASNTVLLEEETDYEKLIHESWDYGRHFIHIDKDLKKGEKFRFTVLGSEVSTEHYADPFNEAERLTLYAALEGRARLIDRHKAAWDKLWEADIIIEGDRRSQLAVRSALYHLYAFTRENSGYSMSPMGLSGLGYNGHVFWDTELWMYPPLLMLQPEMAKSLLDYRWDRLDMAKQNAQSHGYKGAMFPWESDDEGQEATPVWAITGPFEHHITGDVAVAYWNYYRITRDKEWLKEKGYPMLKEIADFWVSRVETDENGVSHIYNVVAADEYAENVDDNAFTNGVAIASLKYAVAASQELGLEPHTDWKKISAQIPLLKLSNGVTAEHATYKDTIIKQADVNLLAFPLGVISDPDQIEKDLKFYEPRIDKGGPAMGYATLSILYQRLGQTEKAYELFLKSYQPNEVPPFGVLAECKGCANPYFATGAGGLLQAIIFGFGGVAIENEKLPILSAPLPKAWESLTITGLGRDRETVQIKR
ncbi:MAG: glycoside hydrolase family 65 protein [Bacteroidota bacterium]